MNSGAKDSLTEVQGSLAQQQEENRLLQERLTQAAISDGYRC